MTTLLLYVLAFCSGFAALIYQVAWSRMLSLTFGSTTLAVSAVVAGFMGGMGIGAWLYHRVGDRVDIPLEVYGALEFLSYRVPRPSPQQSAEVQEMLQSPQERDPAGKREFTDDPYFAPLLELQSAHLEWARLLHGPANRRVDRVLEEHPDLALACRTQATVKNHLVVKPPSRR